VAYTNKFLGLHQDLLYYPDTPRIQLLHCLDNNADGGESLFSDGIYAATRLFWESAYQGRRGYLSRTIPGALLSSKTRFGYNKNGNVYTREHTLAKVVTTPRGAPLVESVWWSPPFQIPFAPEHAHSAFHKAAKAFQYILEHRNNVFQYKMKAGECVVFDNWRVLHGRNQFNTASGKRWLKGTYVADKVYTARFDDMPQDVAKEHEVFTELEKEVDANLEYAHTNPDTRAMVDSFREAFHAEERACADAPQTTVKDRQGA
jgi:alpha-ketoglutarate-dependent taurine dioxygenase